MRPYDRWGTRQKSAIQLRFVLLLCVSAATHTSMRVSAAGGAALCFLKRFMNVKAWAIRLKKEEFSDGMHTYDEEGGEQPVTDVLMVFSLVRFIRSQTRVAYVEQWEADARQLLQTEGDHELFMQTERLSGALGFRELSVSHFLPGAGKEKSAGTLLSWFIWYFKRH